MRQGKRHPLSMEVLPIRRRFLPLREMLERRWMRLPSWRRSAREEYGDA
jgi:hypothetical protein